MQGANTWKVSNKTKQNVKVTVRVEERGNKTIGVILKPNTFVLGKNTMTSQLDAQSRKNFVEIDHDFDNSYLNLDLGVVYNEDDIDQIQKDTQEYQNS